MGKRELWCSFSFTQDEAAAQQLKKRRTFRKFTYRGVDLDQLLDMNYEQLMGLVGARARRRFSRGEYGDRLFLYCYIV